MAFHKAKQRATINKESLKMLVPMLTYIFFLSYWWKKSFQSWRKSGKQERRGKKEREKKEKEKQKEGRRIKWKKRREEKREGKEKKEEKRKRKEKETEKKRKGKKEDKKYGRKMREGEDVIVGEKRKITFHKVKQIATLNKASLNILVLMLTYIVFPSY